MKPIDLINLLKMFDPEKEVVLNNGERNYNVKEIYVYDNKIVIEGE
ncbi:hypothetical protein H3009_gp09 [Bacillus phage Harambe]|uniref:Uncharacterized protein n=1 Tax=Bacillus phage Harambe TaxID=1981931 RepID=A0A1W6JSA8_9CAUD|nr:hypothetical protein H3009_gp09 [Bacillus phage Harambe]ARM70158.1 hypothetical protein HARAMBE_9 [Bacillus phage Harambe]